jgi:uncharacterized protein YbaR (Trm112 family)
VDDGTESEVVAGRLACSACGATYPIRQGIPFLLPAHLRETVEARARETYADEFAEYQTKATPAVARLLAKLARSAKVIIDIGSGRCPYLHLFRGDLICVDLFPPFLYDLQAKKGPPHVRVHAICASATHLPFRDGVADLVFASQVIEHLWPDEARMALVTWPRLARQWCVIDTVNGHEDSLITRLRHLIYGSKSLTDVFHPELNELDHHSTFAPVDFRRAGYTCHGCIGWVSRQRFPLGPLWDLYDAIAWHFPVIGGTLIAVTPGTGKADSSAKQEATIAAQGSGPNFSQR